MQCDVFIFKAGIYLGCSNWHTDTASLSPPAGQTLYGRVLWNPEQNLNAGYRLQLEKVYLCTGRDGYVPFFDPTGTLYNEGPQYGCIQPNKNLKHRFLLLVNKLFFMCGRLTQVLFE